MQITLKPKLRSAFFWVITQQVVVIPHGRFRTTYRSHLEGSRIQKKVFRMSGRNVALPLHRSVLCVTSGFRREADENCARLDY
jgi:hypothetical protein